MKPFLRRRLYIGIIVFLIVVIFLGGVLLSNFDSKIDSNLEEEQVNRVERVIDGDTFVLESGEKVRLICVDTPEIGEVGSIEAKEFLEDLVLGKEVRLEVDVSEKDRYGRLLLYVYVNVSVGNEEEEVFVNREIVKQDFGKVFRYGNDTARCGEIEGLS